MTSSTLPLLRPGDAAPSPPPLVPQSEVTADWRDGPPRVSLLCPTYNHVDFVMDTLAGFLGQRTDFPFEIVVRDDASTDGTQEVLTDLARRYPDIIRLILEPSNTWGRTHFLEPLLAAATGQYLALCAGDDYWIDPSQIARQVEILDRSPGLVGVFHDMVLLREGRVVSVTQRFRRERDLSARRLRRAQGPSIQTLCYRRWDDDGIPYLNRVVTEDYFLTARLGRLGPMRYVPSLGPTIYRIHDESLWSTKPLQNRAIERAVSFYWIGAYFAEHGDRATARYYLRRSAEDIAQSHLAGGIDPRPRLALLTLVRWPRTSLGRLLRRFLPALMTRIRD